MTATPKFNPSRLFLLLVAMSVVVSLASRSTIATSEHFGPNPNDIKNSNSATWGDGSKLGYLVARTGYIKISQTVLEIYSNKQKLAVFVSSADLCNSSNTPYIDNMIDVVHREGDGQGGDMPLPSNKVVTDYEFSSMDGSNKLRDTASGLYKGNANCEEGASSPDQFGSAGDTIAAASDKLSKTSRVMIVTSNDKVEGLRGIYKYKFKADISYDNSCNNDRDRCFLNAFRLKAFIVDDSGILRAPVDGEGRKIWISQAPSDTSDGSGAREFGISPGRGASPGQPNYYDYRMRFGPDCSLKYDTGQNYAIKTISIYDDDNNKGSNDPSVAQMQNSPFVVRLEKKLRKVAGSDWLPHWMYARSDGWRPEVNSGFVDLPPPYPSFDEAPGPVNKAARYYMSGTNSEYRFVVGTDSSKQLINLRFKVEKDYVYRLTLINIYKNNNMQFSLPYSSVWSDDDNMCTIPARALVDNMRDALAPGDTITPTFTAKNLFDRPTIYDGRVKYKRRIWLEKDTGTARSYDASDKLLRADDGYKNVNGTLSNGNDATLVDPGPTLPAGTPSNWTPAMEPGYVRACADLEIVANDNEYTSTFVDIGKGYHYDIKCGPSLKYPSLSVIRGDVRTGGRFPVSGGSCTASTTSSTDINKYASLSIIGHDYGGRNDSLARDGVLSAGVIQNFGSMNMSSSVANNMLSFANKSSGLDYNGLFYGPYGPSTSFNTHCLTDVTPSRYGIDASTLAFTPVGPGLQTVVLNSSGAGAAVYGYRLNGADTDLHLKLSGPIPPGKRIYVIVKSSNASVNPRAVQIDSDIAYEGSGITDLSQLPQFVMMIDNGGYSDNGATPYTPIRLRIGPSVKRLDGIYAANSLSENANKVLAANFVTCAEYPLPDPAAPPPSSTVCPDQLVVNGAVIARGNLKPYRTYGHDASGKTDPAEIFNLRSDVVLGDYYGNSNGQLRLQTLSQSELAPRY